MKIKGLFLLVVLLVSFSAIGQYHKHGKEIMEEIKTRKIAFFTEKLELTSGEAERFWPVYNELESERAKIQTKRWEYHQKFRSERDNLSDKDLLELADGLVELQIEEGELTNRFNKKFQEILEPEQVVKLYFVEGKFRAHLMREYSDRRRQGQGRGNRGERE
jgi:hypothetical protein